MEAEQERCLQEGKVSHRAELLWAAKYLSLTLLLEFQQVIHFVSLCFTDRSPPRRSRSFSLLPHSLQLLIRAYFMLEVHLQLQVWQ